MIQKPLKLHWLSGVLRWLRLDRISYGTTVVERNNQVNHTHHLSHPYLLLVCRSSCIVGGWDANQLGQGLLNCPRFNLMFNRSHGHVLEP